MLFWWLVCIVHVQQLSWQWTLFWCEYIGSDCHLLCTHTADHNYRKLCDQLGNLMNTKKMKLRSLNLSWCFMHLLTSLRLVALTIHYVIMYILAKGEFHNCNRFWDSTTTWTFLCSTNLCFWAETSTITSTVGWCRVGTRAHPWLAASTTRDRTRCPLTPWRPSTIPFWSKKSLLN